MPADEKQTKQEEVMKTPQSLVKEDQVKLALKAQCGEEAELKSWAVYDFTNKGDNYACIVSSVMVTYMLYEKKHWTSFVVKLNPCRGMMQDSADMMFEKEGHFYTKIIPELNKALASAGQTELKVPKCYHTHLENGNQVIYLEDLRDNGYKMVDRKLGLDVPHLILLVKEIGRLHAASILFKGTRTKEQLIETYPCLKEMFASSAMMGKPEMKQFMKTVVDGAANMASLLDGYEKLSENIRNMDFSDDLKKMLVSSNPFQVICHGDCWSNNILFKYDKQGNPLDVRLLDLQISRIASPALDLNYLFYTSTTGNIRRRHLPVLLSAYNSNFNSVLAGGDKTPLFTLDELTKEFYGKNRFGLCMSLMLIPMIVANQEDVPDFENVTEEHMEEFMKKHQERQKKSLKTNPLLKPRLLDMFDEMIENGVIQN